MAMSRTRKSNAIEKLSFEETIVPSGRWKKLFGRDEFHVTSRFWFVAFQRNRFVSPMVFQPRARGSLEKFSLMTAARVQQAAAIRPIINAGARPLILTSGCGDGVRRPQSRRSQTCRSTPQHARNESTTADRK